MSKKQVLMMYEDGSFTVIAIREYHKRMIANKLRANVEIFQDPFACHQEKKYCVRVPNKFTKLMSLSELPEETRSLLFLYEI